MLYRFLIQDNHKTWLNIMCPLSQQSSKIEDLLVSVIKLLNSTLSVSNRCKYKHCKGDNKKGEGTRKKSNPLLTEAVNYGTTPTPHCSPSSPVWGLGHEQRWVRIRGSQDLSGRELCGGMWQEFSSWRWFLCCSPAPGNLENAAPHFSPFNRLPYFEFKAGHGQFPSVEGHCFCS